MEYRTRGRSGVSVSNLCLGTMTFGAKTDEAGDRAQLDQFVAAGGNLVDTADVCRLQIWPDGSSRRKTSTGT